MQNVSYSFSSVHINVDPPLSDEIIRWGRKNVSDDDIFVSQTDPTYGREDEIHITILYGIHSDQSDEVEKTIKGVGPIKAKLGKVKIFSNPYKFDVVVVGVISEDLERLNQKLTETVTYTNRYGKYDPHLTIAYVKKGKGWRHNDLNLWEGREITADYVVFSSKAGFKKKIPLSAHKSLLR
jgi:2'-5' RNA ligase